MNGFFLPDHVHDFVCVLMPHFVPTSLNSIREIGMGIALLPFPDRRDRIVLINTTLDRVEDFLRVCDFGGMVCGLSGDQFPVSDRMRVDADNVWMRVGIFVFVIGPLSLTENDLGRHEDGDVIRCVINTWYAS